VIERRRWRRQRLRRDCILDLEDGVRVEAQTVDISRNGVLVAVKGLDTAKFSEGERVTVRVPLAGKQDGSASAAIKFDAAVVRVEDGTTGRLVAFESNRVRMISRHRPAESREEVGAIDRLLM
jgi:hypothetical protein